MYLYTSNDETIRVGEQLQLNCTVVRAVNSTEVQLSWYYGVQRLTNLTRKLSNETIQLVISHVSWSDSGIYVCKENHTDRVQPMSVMVRVGGKFRMQYSVIIHMLQSCSSYYFSHVQCLSIMTWMVVYTFYACNLRLYNFAR